MVLPAKPKAFACVVPHVKVQCKYTTASVSVHTAGHMGGSLTPGFSIKITFYKINTYTLSLVI